MVTVIRKTESQAERRREILHAVGWQVQVGSTVWSPPTDVYETETEVVVRVEVAGMREQDFEVALQDDTLFVSGIRPDVPERRAYHQMEIRFGKFASAVGLPGSVNADEARAEYRDGFLTVVLPKSKPSQIRIKSK
ncbi:MAG: Hsp20/alpha crystallin family protein [Chloroflexota bacterium]